EAALGVTKYPLDTWTKYTLEHTLGANELAWRQGYLGGQFATAPAPAQKAMSDVLAFSEAGRAALPHLKVLLSQEKTPDEIKNKAMTALAMQTGNGSRGRVVFQRNCTSCHRAGNGEGQDYGPNMEKVGTRLTRVKLIESMIDPNADVDPKYLSTRVDLLDGKSITGLLVSETKTELAIFDGKEKKTIKVEDIEKRSTLKQSSMPEGQAGAMAPSEFVDLIEYLAGLK
ncbi:MAG: c-type cytochrome, partial [Gemmataceae bacterium]